MTTSDTAHRTTARRIVLASRPEAVPGPEHFRLETVELPELTEGDLELKVRYLSLDPYMRGRMSDAESYAEPVPVGGVDVYWENVGGAVWDAVRPRLNMYSRVPVCGLVAQYNTGGLGDHDRLPATMTTVLTRSVTVRGFIQTEFADHYDDFLAEVGPLVADGTVTYREDTVEGLENAPEAFTGMLVGRNFGKLLVRVG